MRGAGNLLGPEQSGFVHAVGFDMYLRMLEETVQRADARRRRARSSCRPTSRSTSPTYLPDDYVDVAGRQARRLPAASRASTTPAEIEALRAELRDRFGPLPRAGRGDARAGPAAGRRRARSGSRASWCAATRPVLPFGTRGAPDEGALGGVSRGAVPGGGAPRASAVAQAHAARRRADARRARARAASPSPDGGTSAQPCRLPRSSHHSNRSSLGIVRRRRGCHSLVACDGLKEALTPTSTSSRAPARRSSPSRASATCSATPRSRSRSTRTSRSLVASPTSGSLPAPRRCRGARRLAHRSARRSTTALSADDRRRRSSRSS